MSVDGQPADNLPTVNYNFRLRDSTDNVQLVVLRSGREAARLSVAPVEQRSDFDAVSAMADPEKNLVPELGILGVEIDAGIAAAATGARAIRTASSSSRARRARRARSRFSRGTSSATEQPGHRDAAGPPRRDARPHARHAGDAADSARRPTDVCVLHARSLIGTIRRHATPGLGGTRGVVSSMGGLVRRSRIIRWAGQVVSA